MFLASATTNQNQTKTKTTAKKYTYNIKHANEAKWKSGNQKITLKCICRSEIDGTHFSVGVYVRFSHIKLDDKLNLINMRAAGGYKRWGGVSSCINTQTETETQSQPCSRTISLLANVHSEARKYLYKWNSCAYCACHCVYRSRVTARELTHTQTHT